MAEQLKYPGRQPTIHTLTLARVTLDPEVQGRAAEDVELEREYAASMLEGAEFPPIDVFWERAADRYWLADGFHRTRAALAAGLKSIKAYVYLGSKRDAILHAAGANASHGLRRSNEDKRAVVLRLLDDPEWCLWSNVDIAKVCRVSPGLVDHTRKSNPTVRGHAVATRVGANGVIRHNAPAVLPAGVAAAPAMESPPLTKAEVHRLYASRIAKHLRKTHPETQLDVTFGGLGTVELATDERIYHTLIGRDTDYLYRTVGRMVVARQVLGPKLGITLVGHFSPGTEQVIEILKGLNVECVTPDELLRRKG